MRKISRVVNGTLLKNTEPAAIERVLLDKVRTELGEFHDLATIKPVLRIDKEDGDLSGNVENGFGTVILNVSGKTIHLPFIIHGKELLPFDVIKMDEQEVSYDLAKLRKLVVAIDKKVKEQSSDEVGGDTMDVVDIRDISTHNGFLGTIMNVRDSHKNRDVNGFNPYDGVSFGDMDDQRIERMASVDVADVFHEFHEKLSAVKHFTSDDVKTVVEGIEKKAALEESKVLSAASNADAEATTVKTQRKFEELDKQKLARHSLVASGNNVKFPVFDGMQFEFRQGRVYSNVKSAAGNKNDSKISHVVVDTRHHYALLTNRDQFMVSVESPGDFKFPMEQARGLLTGEMYAFEFDMKTISTPFYIKEQYLEEEENNGIIISVPERAGFNEVLKASQSNLFRNALYCEENGKEFTILIARNRKVSEGIELISNNDLNHYVTTHAENSTDHRISKMIANRYSHSNNIYLVPEDTEFFKMFKNITGFFKRPDGLLKEGPLFEKSAAYEQADKARLYINDKQKPVTYNLEWSFSEKRSTGREEGFGIEKKKMDNLPPSQAKQMLEQLGYSHAQQASFFEIAKRNGRYAEFRLPNKELASNASPKDKARNKAKDAVKNIANSTLNAGNFLPLVEDVLADTAAEYISYVAPNSPGWAKSVKEKLASSLDTAIEFEKVATSTRGSAWSEVAYLLNVKSHMDKLANDTSDKFLVGATDVFQSVRQLQPVIEKTAASLIEFNRDQAVRTNSPLVTPVLVKQAIHQLDGLSGYVKIAEELEKKSFFHKGTRKQLEVLNHSLSDLQKQNNKVVRKLKNQNVDLRVLDRKKLTDTEQGKKKVQEIQQTQKEFQDITKKLGDNARERTALEHKMDSTNRKIMTAAGVPGLAGLSYGYQSFKDKE